MNRRRGARPGSHRPFGPSNGAGLERPIGVPRAAGDEVPAPLADVRVGYAALRIPIAAEQAIREHKVVAMSQLDLGPDSAQSTRNYDGLCFCSSTSFASTRCARIIG